MAEESPTASQDAVARAAATAAADDVLDPSTLVDLEVDYEVLGELGRGGSAVVYRARDRELGREVAVKVVRAAGPIELLPAPAGSAAGRSPTSDEPLARLAREARAVARLQHPNIVGVYAIRRLQQGGLALVMELIPGRTLKDVLRDEGPLAPERAARVLRAVAEALRFSHKHGVVHRDVKPENIFLDTANDRVLLSDFGIARLDESDTRLTQTGTTLGTPAYMSPEQIAGGAVDGRSDLYSLGLVAWEMLAGRQPWEGATLYDLLEKQRRATLPPIDAVRPADRGPVPLRLQYVIERMLQKEPGARWPSVDGVLAQLEGRGELPADYAPWLHAHRRRVEAYRRSEESATARVPRDEPTQRLSVPDGGEAAPVWVEEAKARRSRLRIVGVAAVVILGTTGALLSRRLVERPATPVATVAGDRAAIEVPVAAAPSPVPRSAAPHVDSVGGTVADAAPAPSTPAPSVVAPSAVTSPAPTTPPPAAPRRTATTPTAKPPSTPAAAAIAAAATTPPTAPPGVPGGAGAAPVVVERSTIAVGGRHTCALGSGGRAYCWGANDRGQLGADDVDGRATPGAVTGDVQFAQIAAGVAHTCALTRAGDAYCWGNDEHGELGDATTSSRDAPVRVAGGLRFRVVRTGLSHSCGVTGDGAVACWGANASGQLGDGTTTPRTSPVLASAGTARFATVATGWRHTCALTTDGLAFCWGANDDGQLGDGTRDGKKVATPVAGGLRFVGITAGSAHSCAVTAGGEVYCWGRNAYGQLGTGTPGERATPTRVDTPLRFASVVAGSVHTCGRTVAGLVACWGRNVYGQLGDGTTVDRATPVRVPGAFASVDATGAHTCGVTLGGAVACWGYNVEGQLGDGTRTHRASPGYIEKPLP